MTYFVSDIHGYYELFLRLLEKIGFSDADELYVLGDVIDKGKDSVRLIKHIMEAENIHMIIGNHEHSLLYEYHSLMEDSPEDFGAVLDRLQSRFERDDERLTFEMLDWLERLPYYIEGEDFIAVHAGIPVDSTGRVISPADALPEQLIYDRVFKDPTFAPRGDKCVIFGHTPTMYISEKAVILAYKKKGCPGDSIKDFCKIHIDMGTWTTKILGCFCKEKLTATYIKG